MLRVWSLMHHVSGLSYGATVIPYHNYIFNTHDCVFVKLCFLFCILSAPRKNNFFSLVSYILSAPKKTLKKSYKIPIFVWKTKNLNLLI